MSGVARGLTYAPFADGSALVKTSSKSSETLSKVKQMLLKCPCVFFVPC